MLADLSSSEYADWETFSQVEPIGMDRADLHAAIVASTVANVNRDRKKKPQPWRFADFIPFLPNPEKEKTLSQRIKDAFRNLGRSDGQ